MFIKLTVTKTSSDDYGRALTRFLRDLLTSGNDDLFTNTESTLYTEATFVKDKCWMVPGSQPTFTPWTLMNDTTTNTASGYVTLSKPSAISGRVNYLRISYTYFVVKVVISNTASLTLVNTVDLPTGIVNQVFDGCNEGCNEGSTSYEADNHLYISVGDTFLIQRSYQQ